MPTRLSLAGLLVWSGPGCAEAPEPPMLHALPSFSGEVAIAGLDDAAATKYELSFSRQNGYFAAKFETAGRVITLLAGTEGALEVFEDTRVRAATPDEQARFALVRDLVDPKAVEKIEPREDHYRAWRAGTGYSVRLEPVAAGFHSAHGGDGTGGTARRK